MIANLRSFGNMDIDEANRELRENLKVVKSQAEALEYSMDLTIRRIAFESGELEKWESLRKSLVDFRSLEVNPIFTKSAINRIINDLILEADKNFKNKHKSSVNKTIDSVKPMEK